MACQARTGESKDSPKVARNLLPFSGLGSTPSQKTAKRPQGILNGIAPTGDDRKRAQGAVRQLSGQILRLQDEERRRIARDLHGSTAQLLTALSMNLSLAGRRPSVALDEGSPDLL